MLLISIVIIEYMVIKLVDSVRKVNTMIGMVIKVNEMVSNVTSGLQGLVRLTG